MRSFSEGTGTTMNFEHAFQQSGFLVAFQLMLIGSIVAPAEMGGEALLHKFIRTMASFVVSFGPMAILIYMLYRLSQMS
jgi:hypothetical protein